MKTFAWNKLPVNKIFGKNNIWTKMAKTFEKEKSSPIGRTIMSMSGSWYLNDRNINFSKICSAKSEYYGLLIIISSSDFRDMENLFCLVAPKAPEISSDGKVDAAGNGEKKKKEMSEVNLLDGKRSLNINIFLRQFRR